MHLLIPFVFSKNPSDKVAKIELNYDSGFVVFKSAMLLIALVLGGCSSDTGEKQFTESIALDNIETIASAVEAAGGEVVIGDVLCCPETYLGVPSQTMSVNGENVIVTIFDSKASADSTIEHIAPDGHFIERNDALLFFNWVNTPHFFSRNNSIVLYVGDNLEIVNLLENSIGLQFAGG